jgi:Protein of unknown function (DUF3303)
MKYVMVWTSRLNGSGKENEAAMRRGLEVFSKWQPPASTTFHQFVGRLDAAGGFIVLETDDPTTMLDAAGKFSPFNEFHIYPVIDIADWAQTLQDGVEFRESIS